MMHTIGQASTAMEGEMQTKSSLNSMGKAVTTLTLTGLEVLRS